MPHRKFITDSFSKQTFFADKSLFKGCKSLKNPRCPQGEAKGIITVRGTLVGRHLKNL